VLYNAGSRVVHYLASLVFLVASTITLFTSLLVYLSGNCVVLLPLLRRTAIPIGEYLLELTAFNLLFCRVVCLITAVVLVYSYSYIGPYLDYVYFIV